MKENQRAAMKREASGSPNPPHHCHRCNAESANVLQCTQCFVAACLKCRVNMKHCPTGGHHAFLQDNAPQASVTGNASSTLERLQKGKTRGSPHLARSHDAGQTTASSSSAPAMASDRSAMTSSTDTAGNTAASETRYFCSQLVMECYQVHTLPHML